MVMCVHLTDMFASPTEKWRHGQVKKRGRSKTAVSAACSHMTWSNIRPCVECTAHAICHTATVAVAS